MLNLYTEIQLAQYQDITTILEKVVHASDLLINMAHKELAASFLAFVIWHAQSSDKTRARAGVLFDELETELCPRVIWDAREFAHEMTLERIAAELVALN